jgi:hypothetical protein
MMPKAKEELARKEGELIQRPHFVLEFRAEPGVNAILAAQIRVAPVRPALHPNPHHRETQPMTALACNKRAGGIAR